MLSALALMPTVCRAHAFGAAVGDLPSGVCVVELMKTRFQDPDVARSLSSSGESEAGRPDPSWTMVIRRRSKVCGTAALSVSPDVQKLVDA